MLSSIAPLLLVSLGLAPSAHAWWWEGDDYDRTARVAAIVVGLLAGTALILFAVFYAIRRQRKVAAEFAEFRPPPPPGVVGYDSPYGPNPPSPPPTAFNNEYGGYSAEEPTPPPPAYQAHTFPPSPGEGSSWKGDDSKHDVKHDGKN